MKHLIGEMECPSCVDKLKQAHPVLSAWFTKVKAAFPDFHVSCSYRGQEEQERVFREGKSKLPWPQSKHNLLPAQAIDLFQINPNGAGVWDPLAMKRVVDLIPGPIRWGGMFKFGDHDHMELDLKQLGSASQGGEPES